MTQESHSTGGHVSDSDPVDMIDEIQFGDYILRVSAVESGYRMDLCSDRRVIDSCILTPHKPADRAQKVLDSEYKAIDSEVVFDVLEQFFSDQDFWIRNINTWIEHMEGRGAELDIEATQQGRSGNLAAASQVRRFRVKIWPTDGQRTDITDAETGEQIETYKPLTQD